MTPQTSQEGKGEGKVSFDGVFVLLLIFFFACLCDVYMMSSCIYIKSFVNIYVIKKNVERFSKYAFLILDYFTLYTSQFLIILPGIHLNIKI